MAKTGERVAEEAFEPVIIGISALKVADA